MSAELIRARSTLGTTGQDANRIIVIDSGDIGTALFTWKGKASITTLFMCNRHTDSKWVSVGIQRQTNDLIYQLYQYKLSPTDFVPITMSLHMLTGDYLVAWAESANAIELHVSGFQSLR